MSAREQYEFLYTLSVGLTSGTVGLASWLERADLWLSLEVAILCGFAGGLAKIAGMVAGRMAIRRWRIRRNNRTKG